MTIFFNIAGGIGKCIAATAVCEAIKKQYPEAKLFVGSAYPDVFIGNPHVYRTFMFGGVNYFYSDYVQDQDFKVFSHDPYLETSFLRREKHLIETWCEMFGVPYNGEKPQLFLNQQELETYSKKYVSDKPILVLQTNGGAIEQQNKYSWARDIPDNVIQEVINEFKKDYTIAHIRREDQKAFDDTVRVTDNFRSVATLILMSKKRLLIDSFAQHTSAAFQLPSTVLWVVNDPKVFGYEIHDNILANPETKQPDLKSSFLQKYDITGDITQFPYNDKSEIFDVNKVIQSLKK
jgi:ADP-heptose:LPS heptosyltransferase